MSAISRLKWWCASIVERHPYTQNLAKRMLLRLPMLLPHDRSYLGMRHMLDHENRLFLDVGANDGISAVSFRQIDCQQTFSIVSIEPSRLHEASLQRIALRDKKFSYRLLAAGDRPATLELYTPIYKRSPLHTAASLSREHAEAMMHTYMPAYIARRVRYEHQTVKVVPLDELALAPGIIKIDAEGFDDKVLAGLRETIRRHRPYILTERHPETASGLDAFCTSSSYMMLLYDDQRDVFTTFTGTQTRNVYCVPLERAAALPRSDEETRRAA